MVRNDEIIAEMEDKNAEQTNPMKEMYLGFKTTKWAILYWIGFGIIMVLCALIFWSFTS